MKPEACFSPYRHSCCSRPEPMTETYTLACCRSPETSVRVTVTALTRGSRSSNRMVSLATSRTTSATRANRCAFMGLVGQAFQPDISVGQAFSPDGLAVRLESLTYALVFWPQ